jgi:UDPglucose 6-dehydrogenase
MNKNIKIGFIGQGWIGKNYANDFERRGFEVVRYALEEPYVQNKDLVKTCDIVFVAVPTPTTENGFDYSIVEASLKNVGEGKIAVIKSTILPETTEILQEKFPKIFVMHSPEFLREIYAAYDAEHPTRNILGVPKLNEEYLGKAETVMSVLAKAPYNKIMHSKEAELVKYIGNCFLYEKVVFFNQMYDLANKLGLDYQNIREAVSKDERIGDSHTAVAHASGHNQKVLGRGAGGHCFIKDFEAMIELFKKTLPEDTRGYEALMAIREKNNELLVKSNKDLDLLKGVIGDVSRYEDR